MNAKYCISIVTFTAFEHCKRAVQSVFDHSSDFHLIITVQGNPKSAKYFEAVARENKNVSVMVNDRNLGFVIPSNRAFTLCLSPRFVLLNDDCVCSPGWLEALDRPFNDFLTCAASGPVGGHFGSSLNPDKNAVEFLWGHCMMVSTEVVRPIGLFSDYIHWAYYDELDLNFRLMERGFTLHLTPDCKVKHVGKATSAGLPGIREIQRWNYLEVLKRFPRYFGKVK